MKLGIMQPYFFPYVGYFQLINAVDNFVIYDNIKYTKKGWINRNKYLLNGSPHTFSIPLKKDSDYLNIIDRVISEDFNKNKLLNQIRGAYSKSPCFERVFPLIERIINFEDNNLFKFLKNSLNEICIFLNLDINVIDSSSLKIDHSLKGQAKVIEICKNLNSSIYINPIGGTELYSKSEFEKNNIELKFINSNVLDYYQFDSNFVESLSIIDLLFFVEEKYIGNHLQSYKLDT